MTFKDMLMDEFTGKSEVHQLRISKDFLERAEDLG